MLLTPPSLKVPDFAGQPFHNSDSLTQEHHTNGRPPLLPPLNTQPYLSSDPQQHHTNIEQNHKASHDSPIQRPLAEEHSHADSVAQEHHSQQQQQQQQEQQEQQQSLLPAPPGGRYAHHAFVPKPRAQSAFMRRHQAAHPTPSQRIKLGQKGSASARPRRTSPLTSFPEEGGLHGGHSRSLFGGDGSWSHVSSMGDLEALDTILDTLVVANPKMRQALLQGPLVSFETVVSEPKARGPVTALDEDAALRDRTFNLTSVPGVVEENDAEPEFPDLPPLSHHDMEDLRARAGQEMEAERLAKQQQEQDQEERQIASEKQQQQQQQQQQQPEEQSNETHAPGLQATATVPVPILPKLARMYISSKQHQASKAPPPPPPTAHWLVHSRPHPNPQAAPSYDNLCSQIRDVQRQYTCGSSRRPAPGLSPDHEPGRVPRINPNLGMYISGLDGPALDEVAQAQGLPQGLERSRPSFVAMQQTKGRQSSRRGMRSRSPGREPMAHYDTHALQTTGANVDGNESPGSD